MTAERKGNASQLARVLLHFPYRRTGEHSRAETLLRKGRLVRCWTRAEVCISREVSACLERDDCVVQELLAEDLREERKLRWKLEGCGRDTPLFQLSASPALFPHSAYTCSWKCFVLPLVVLSPKQTVFEPCSERL